MKEIKLTQGFVAQVDDEDFEYLNQFKWYAAANPLKKSIRWYAIRHEENNNRLIISMHREIMNTAKGFEVDHIDHNGLNNQRINLRNCNKEQNGRNRASVGQSKYLGVNFYYSSSGKKYIRAALRLNKKYTYLGTFINESEAAFAYDIAAMQNHKEFANTNFKYAEWFKRFLYNRN
jgi:AP2 domain.